MTIQMKTCEKCFGLVLIIMLKKILVTSISVNETLVCDHSNGRYREVPSFGSVYCVEERCSNF